MKSEFKKRDRGEAAREDIHQDIVRAFQMLELPVYLIIHFTFPFGVPLFLPGVEKEIIALFDSE